MSLRGKKVVLTRARHQSREWMDKLQALGAAPINFPTIQIRPVEDPGELDAALSNLSRFDWLVLTSANAVETVLQRFDALDIQRMPEDLRLASVGAKTAERLQKAGVRVDFVPQEYIAEAVLPGLGDLRGKRVLLPTADIAHDTLPTAIRAAGGDPHVITAYHTLPADPDPSGLSAIQEGVDVVTFTSGSTARNFIALLKAAGLDPFHLKGDPLVACIGPKTAKAAREAGLRVDIVAKEYTLDGLLNALQDHFEG